MSQWKFPVSTSGIPVSSDESWGLTKEVQSAFCHVVEALCPLIERCKKRCEATKQAGRLDAFQVMTARVHSMSDRVPLTFTLVNAMARELLEMEEQAVSEEKPSSGLSGEKPYPHEHSTPSLTLRSLDYSAISQHNDHGWQHVEGMHVESDYTKARLALAEFNKIRTKEIRLAYVCGFRDALKQMLDWIQKQARSSPVSREEFCAYLTSCCMRQTPHVEEDGDLSSLSSDFNSAVSKLGEHSLPVHHHHHHGQSQSRSGPCHRSQDMSIPEARTSGTFAQFLAQRQAAEAKAALMRLIPRRSPDDARLAKRDPRVNSDSEDDTTDSQPCLARKTRRIPRKRK
eukprot:m.100116 g.100116  ORF g.100116 m.100116 type:complete len:342 (-) comp14925_c0_seq8:159-1184(-)